MSRQGTHSRAERNLRLTIEYDGTHFHGWQSQPEVRTVQGTLSTVIGGLTGEAVELQGASRTDRGVHAAGQVAHFLTKSPIPDGRLACALNGRLPSDVRVRTVEQVEPDFHARFSAVAKRYGYLLDRGEPSSVFVASRTLHFPGPLNRAAMEEAAALLVGEHDFAAFRCLSGGEQDRENTTTVRTIHQVTIHEGQGLLLFRVLGSGFLYKMVRTLVGSLIEVGSGRWDVNRFREGMESLQRPRMGPTLPPQGLCLEEVYYDNPALERALATPSEEVVANWVLPRSPFAGKG